MGAVWIILFIKRESTSHFMGATPPYCKVISNHIYIGNILWFVYIYHRMHDSYAEYYIPIVTTQFPLRSIFVTGNMQSKQYELLKAVSTA